MDLLVHFNNWEQLLKEQSRLCKIGGTVMFNFISADNIRSLNSDGVPGTVKDFYYITDYAPIATREDILKAASRCNLEIELIQPYNFFSSNAWFCRYMDKMQSDCFMEFLNSSMKNPDILNFISEFERTVVRNLPLSSCCTMFVKLRKLK